MVRRSAGFNLAHGIVPWSFTTGKRASKNDPQKPDAPKKAPAKPGEQEGLMSGYTGTAVVAIACKTSATDEPSWKRSLFPVRNAGGLPI